MDRNHNSSEVEIVHYSETNNQAVIFCLGVEIFFNFKVI